MALLKLYCAVLQERHHLGMECKRAFQYADDLVEEMIRMMNL
jgi:hypothetical protein